MSTLLTLHKLIQAKLNLPTSIVGSVIKYDLTHEPVKNIKNLISLLISIGFTGSTALQDTFIKSIELPIQCLRLYRGSTQVIMYRNNTTTLTISTDEYFDKIATKLAERLPITCLDKPADMAKRYTIQPHNWLYLDREYLFQLDHVLRSLGFTDDPRKLDTAINRWPKTTDEQLTVYKYTYHNESGFIILSSPPLIKTKILLTIGLNEHDFYKQ